MISANELKPGITFQHNNDIFVVVACSQSKQARSQPLIKTKIKNLRTGTILSRIFNSKDKFNKANIQKKKVNFLYNDQNTIFFIDATTFEEIKVPLEMIKWEKNFLTSNCSVVLRMFGSEILGIELPANIEAQVTYASFAVKGNTQNNAFKKIQIETGFELEAPIFINEKDFVIVASKDGKYVGKVSK